MEGRLVICVRRLHILAKHPARLSLFNCESAELNGSDVRREIEAAPVSRYNPPMTELRIVTSAFTATALFLDWKVSLGYDPQLSVRPQSERAYHLRKQGFDYH